MNLVSPIAQVIDETIKKKVMAQLILALGLASIPVMGPILTAMINFLADLAITWLLTETVIGGARIWVMLQVDWSVKDVEAMKAQLQDLLDDPTKYTAEQQAEIEKGFDEAAVKLIHLTNARVTI